MRSPSRCCWSLRRIGVGWGLVEAWRFRPILAMLMALLLSVISLFIWIDGAHDQA